MIKILGATLLSLEEYVKYESKIPKLKSQWWLRSSGKYANKAAFVYNVCSYSMCNTYDYGYDIVTRRHSIRPALQLQGSGNTKIGEVISFGGYKFIIISSEYALCTKAIGFTSFRKDLKAPNNNDYEASDIKKYIDNWFDCFAENTKIQNKTEAI